MTVGTTMTKGNPTGKGSSAANTAGMPGSSFTLEDLRACLASVAPVELKGMGLLVRQPHLITAMPSVPRHELVEAVTEIVAYSGRCAAAARQLTSLTPIPLNTATVLEFGV